MASDIKWIRSLPMRPASSAAVFFNKAGEMLIVKPNYKPGWQVPGGIIDPNEPPSHGCVREIKEEIGLDTEVDALKLIGVSHGIQKSDTGELYDLIYFAFFAGELTDKQISEIKLQTSELDEMKFMNFEDASPLLNDGIRIRLKAALEGLKNNTVSYTEFSL